jgi:hypothetical protein
MTLCESSLISSLYGPLWMQCAAVCSANPKCKTAIYDDCQGRLIYNRYFKASELLSSCTGAVYVEKFLSKIIFKLI